MCCHPTNELLLCVAIPLMSINPPIARTAHQGGASRCGRAAQGDRARGEAGRGRQDAAAGGEKLASDAFDFGDMPLRVDLKAAKAQLAAAEGKIDKKLFAKLTARVASIEGVQTAAKEGKACEFLLLDASKVRHSTGTKMLSLQVCVCHPTNEFLLCAAIPLMSSSYALPSHQ